MSTKIIEHAQVGRIFLLLSNPRHEPFATETKAIEYLCDKEQVLPLARDIVRYGLNPLERFALIPVPQRGSKARAPSYYVAEGNRRLCAIKLLNDPDLAPSALRKSFEALSKGWKSIPNVPAVLFDDLDTVKIWLERIHNGAQGGIGRREWNADQKQRASGGNKNKAALALLDYAEAEGMISAADRSGKLTTVQRFIGNDVFREMLGFDQSTPDDVSRTRPKAEFDTVLKRFIKDLVGKKDVTSRMNKPDIIRYSRPLSNLPGVTTTRIEPEPLPPEGQSKVPRARKPTPKKPDKAKHIQFEAAIAQALKAYGNEKLQSLYHSICSVELDPHTPLVAIGVWSFFETLSACAGRTGNTSFDSFFSKAKLSQYGITTDTGAIRTALERVRDCGNNTKHHAISAIFNGDQINNDMVVLKDVVLKCIEDAAAKTT